MIHEGADTLVNGQLQYMPARNDMELNVEGLNENGTENLEYCVEQGKNNVGGYREMAYAELKETISNVKSVAIVNEEVLKKLHEEMIKETVHRFVKECQSSGLNFQQTISLLTEAWNN